MEIELDKAPVKLLEDLLVCLQDEPAANEHFKTLSPSHQRYFSNYVRDAKTETTRARRIAQSLHALSRKMDYGQMIREGHARRKELRGE